MLKSFTIGDRVVASDERAGVIKWIDYGGVHVELDPTENAGRELRVYNVSSLTHEEEV